MSITLSEWTDTIRNAYLETYIREGGAALKVAIPQDDRTTVVNDLRALAEELGYVVAVVDAGQTRVHMIDQLFFAVSKQVTWETLAIRLQERACQECGFRVRAGDEPTFDSIAAENSVDPNMVRNELSGWFMRRVLQDYRMSQEFRHAMVTLCMEPLRSPSLLDGLYQSVLDWLRGDLRLIGAVRPAQIYQRVSRKNARDLFVSLGHWSRMVGQSGLVVIVDIAACAVAKRSQTESIYYNRSMVMDLFEVMRQFIDATDDLESVFITVVAAPAFLTDDSRGLATYDALRMRVAEEVRDRTRDNPLASLVRLRHTDS